MNARKQGLINVVAVGVVVLLLTSLGLFWARCLCGTLRHRVLSEMAGPVAIRPSHLLPGEVQGDPNSTSVSTLQASMSDEDPLLVGLGISQYVEAHRPGGYCSDVYVWGRAPDEVWIYFDRSLGLIVYRGKDISQRSDGRTTVQYVTLYAGPEGMGTRPDTELGRFVHPLGEFTGRPWIVYDRALRRFFVIKDWQRAVASGPQLPPGDAYRPVQISLLEKNPPALEFSVLLGRPARHISTDGTPDGVIARHSVHSVTGSSPSLAGTALVLDASGRIDLLDLDTLELTGPVARLPRPATLFAPRSAAGPRDIAAYAVEGIVSMKDGDQGRKWFYAGCAVAVLSADATAVKVEVFDPNGRVIASDETKYARHAGPSEHRSVRENTVAKAYFDVPGAAAVTGLKFALESLHPPVLQLLSYFTASRFEATAGYRSLLVLPNSFVAMKARDSRTGSVNRFMAAGMLMLPSVLLALLFAGLVVRDGAGAGLTKNARSKWFIATLVLGLPACITYRLTRPTIRMVTCRNCGQMRRPDQETCHGCGSAWIVPELTPPAWRVLDAANSADGAWETGRTPPGAVVSRTEDASETP